MAMSRSKARKRSGRDQGGEGWDKLTSMQEILLKEVARSVNIVVDGRSQAVSMEEVVTRKLLQIAANGGQHAIGNAINQIIQAQRIDQQKRDEDVAFGHKYKAYKQSQLDEATKRGNHPNTVLPHPDDIVVENGVGYRINGPIDEAELKAVMRECAWRDAAILQAALEERLGPLDPDPQAGPSKHPAYATAMFMTQVWNEALPERFRKSDLEIAMDLMRYEGVTKRDLLKQAHRTWASLGRPRPRGWRMPWFERLLWSLDNVLPAMMALYPDVKSGKLSSVGAIARRLQQRIGPALAG